MKICFWAPVFAWQLGFISSTLQMPKWVIILCIKSVLEEMWRTNSKNSKKNQVLRHFNYTLPTKLIPNIALMFIQTIKLCPLDCLQKLSADDTKRHRVNVHVLLFSGTRGLSSVLGHPFCDYWRLWWHCTMCRYAHQSLYWSPMW